MDGTTEITAETAHLSPREEQLQRVQDRAALADMENHDNPYFHAQKERYQSDVTVLIEDALKHGGNNIGKQAETIASLLAEKDKEASLDPLTNLYTRAAGERRLNEVLATASRSGEPLTAAMIDLDHFKQVNDSIGHDGGDAVLQQAAAHIQSRLRESDSAIRWGGEEILVVLPNTDEASAREVIDQIRETMPDVVGEAVYNMGFDLGEKKITMSAGVAPAKYNADENEFQKRLTIEETKAAMIKDADKGVYAAKEQGRNRVIKSADLLPIPA